MPSTPKSKTFVATTNFTYNCQAFKPGDKIEAGATLAHLLTFGDKFVAVKGRKADTPPITSEED